MAGTPTREPPSLQPYGNEPVAPISLMDGEGIEKLLARMEADEYTYGTRVDEAEAQPFTPSTCLLAPTPPSSSLPCAPRTQL